MTRLPTYSPGILQTVHHFLLIISLCLTGIIGSRYSRMGQVKFVEGSKICGRYPLQNFTYYIPEYFEPTSFELDLADAFQISSP